MARYIKKYTRVGSMGPTEERGFALWAGYDIVGVDEDLSAQGLQRVDEWPEAIKSVVRVDPDDETTYAALGIERRS